MRTLHVFRPDITGAELLAALKGTEDLACQSPECAPPPVGTGGSLKRSGGSRILKATKEQGGATLNPRAGMKAVTSGYAVSEFPEASFSKPLSELTADDIDSWLSEHRPALSKAGNNVGAWHDTETGMVWLDVVRVYPNTQKGRRSAIAAGVKHNQIAIFHLNTLSEISTGGTGEKIVAALIAAGCRDRSCAPPPVGTGGSTPGARSALSTGLARTKGTKAAKANTSIMPMDVHPVHKANDANPPAPGADNTAAVRAYKGQSGTEPERRIPRQGETVDIYRDLGRGKEHRRGFPDNDAFSVRLASSSSGNQATQVVASTVGIELSTPRPAWAHSAKAKAELSGKREVHGFLRGEVQRYLTPSEAAEIASEPGWERVSYYPGTQDFFLPEGRERVVGGDRAILSKGKFYMLNPQTVPGAPPAPESPIERKNRLVASLLHRG